MTGTPCGVVTAPPVQAALPADYQAALAHQPLPLWRHVWQRLRYGKRAHGFAWCVTHQRVLCRDYRGRLVHHQ